LMHVLRFLEKINLNSRKYINNYIINILIFALKLVPLSFEKSNQILKELMKLKEFIK
jgi:hypothetical protein